MRCKGCPDFINNICRKAEEDTISEMDTECLLRYQIMLLRGIFDELVFQNDDIGDGDGWKQGD